MATRIVTAAQNAAADAVVDLLDGGATAGTLEIRSGTQPADPNSGDAGTLLAEFDLADPAFGAAAAGVATAAAIAATVGVAAGTAGHFRAKDSDGDQIIDGSVTAEGGGGDLELNTTTISIGVDVEITAWTVTMPSGA